MSFMNARRVSGPAIEVARMRLLLALLSQAREHLLVAVDDCQDEHSDRASLSAAALLTTWTIDVLNGCAAQFEQVIAILDEAAGSDPVEETLQAAAAALDPESVVDWAMPEPPVALSCRHSQLTDVQVMFEEAEQTAARLPFADTVSRPIRVLHDWLT